MSGVPKPSANRVLLVDEGWNPTIYVAAGLAAAGWHVTVLTANGTRARCRSRDGVDWQSAPRIGEPGFAARVARTGGDVVVPLTEAAMAALWDAGEPRVFPRTEPWQRALVRDKHALVEHLASRGVPVPRHVRIDEAIELPVVVKGATGSAGQRVRIAETAEQLAATLARARAIGGDWIAQEHLAGPTYLVAGIFDAGRPIRLFAAEKCEQAPARTGTAARLRTTRDPALLDVATRAIAELAWTGFASVDLMRRDGAPVVLEVNPRPWGCIAAAAAAGVELFAPFAQLLAGAHPMPALSFDEHLDATIFPNCLRTRSGRSLERILAHLAGPQGRHWREPRLAIHVLRRLAALARDPAPRL